MTIAIKAAKGVAWNMALGVGSRLLQLAGTLLLTRFLAPDAYGSVLGASLIVLTAGLATSFAFGQYLIANSAEPKVAMHASVIHVSLGVATMALVVMLREPLSRWFGVADAAGYIPGFALAHVLDRTY